MKNWQISENLVTSETTFLQRRKFIKTLISAGITTSILPILGCEQTTGTEGKITDRITEEIQKTLDFPKLANISTNPKFKQVDRPLADEILAGQYNNFYEFGSSKTAIWQNAKKLSTDNWTVSVTGLVKNPRTYDLDDLQKRFPLEERIYRFRCVEAWSMVLPWLGFPMSKIIEDVEPTSKAKYVKFTSYYDPKVTFGPLHFGKLPWPYTEGLRIEEMANELAFFAIGIYGHLLPKQHGAPLRMVMPWKYGFKGAKSIVKIEFVETQPATFWHTIDANEYGFEANVNPDKPHPRWSQATEKFISTGPGLSWTRKETLLYNGYGEYVANLYN